MAASPVISVFSQALPDTVWRASQLGAHPVVTVPSGCAALDRELPSGGWPSAAVTELLLSQAGIGEVRLLVPALMTLMKDGRSVVLLAPPHVPLASALAQLGLDLRRLLVVNADKPADRVWAAEQTLKSNSFGALLCWLPQVSTEQLRRLQVAAGATRGLVFVFRSLEAQEQSSPAPLRLTCRPAPSGCMSLRIIKRRGPTHAGPLVVPLSLHPVLARSFADRTSIPSFSDSLSDVVARPSLSAIANRRRATFVV